MTNCAVFCYGLALWDALADQAGLPRAQVRSWTLYPGGAGLNVACGLGKLGVASALMTGVGQDEKGQELLHILQSHHVGIDDVQKLPYPTRIVEVLRSPDGEREFAGFYPPDCQDFADGYITFVEPQCIPHYLYIEAVMFAFPIARETGYQLLNWALNHGVNILVDVNWRPVFWSDVELAKLLTLELLKKVQMVKLTQAEAHWLLATDAPNLIHRQYPNLTHIFVTKGAQGCDYHTGNYQGYCPAFRVNSVDTTGAGDAFLAGWLHQCVTQGERLTHDADILNQAVRWASAVAALSTTAPGAITHAPTVDAVQAFLTSHPH